MSRYLYPHALEMIGRPSDAKHYASEMLGQKLITKQTGEEGLPCDKVTFALLVAPCLSSRLSNMVGLPTVRRSLTIFA